MLSITDFLTEIPSDLSLIDQKIRTFLLRGHSYTHYVTEKECLPLYVHTVMFSYLACRLQPIGVSVQPPRILTHKNDEFMFV
jgi:hypothetical protein